MKFLSCDWGTSSFRLRLIQDGEVVREFTDATGCRTIFDALPGNDRPKAFENHLLSTVSEILADSDSAVPLVISGMASSTIGWMELPYAEIPLNLDGSNSRIEKVNWASPEKLSATYLISGAASQNEMMRGEETEAIGLLPMLPTKTSETTLVLPGTHSKHLKVQNGAITAIQTYMTGELYEILSRFSVLRASVDTTQAPDLVSFSEGVECARRETPFAALFQTRARQVLQKKTPSSNASFLSGLLIGGELSALGRASSVLIAGADSIRPLYHHAARQLGLAIAHVFSSTEVQLAVPRGHSVLLSKLTQ